MKNKFFLKKNLIAFLSTQSKSRLNGINGYYNRPTHTHNITKFLSFKLMKD